MQIRILLPAVALIACHAAATEYPSASISNEKVRATLYLPDTERGYYRATRFDWSGVIASLESGGHSYFGVWFDKYDPKLHDAITGPVEEFLSGSSALGYDEAPVGGTFIRIGVGTLRKPKEASFQRFSTYEIVDHGKWKVDAKKDHITFEHTLSDATSGYGYVYRKTVRLVPGKAEMVIEHSLRNTGGKKIATDVYNHNFMVIDGQPTGPDFSIAFNFPPKASRDFQGLAEIKGQELHYLKQFTTKDRAMSELTGFSDKVSDHEFRITNRKSGASVRITGDKPLSKIVFWSADRVLSPENYITMSIDPGKDFKWNVRYEFSSASK
jgi:hypothetical protein